MNKTLAFLSLAFILTAGCNLSAAQSKLGIHSIDFRNFTYDLYNWKKVKFVNGHYKEIDKTDGTIYFKGELAILKYADFNGDGKEEAIVLIQSGETRGSNHGDNDYFVFAYRAGKPRQIFHEHREGKEGLCLKNRSITIVAEAWEGIPVPHCCPPFTETKTYRWQGSRFVLIKTDRQKNYPGQNPKLFAEAKRCENIR